MRSARGLQLAAGSLVTIRLLPGGTALLADIPRDFDEEGRPAVFVFVFAFEALVLAEGIDRDGRECGLMGTKRIYLSLDSH